MLLFCAANSPLYFPISSSCSLDGSAKLFRARPEAALCRRSGGKKAKRQPATSGRRNPFFSPLAAAAVSSISRNRRARPLPPVYLIVVGGGGGRAPISSKGGTSSQSCCLSASIIIDRYFCAKAGKNNCAIGRHGGENSLNSGCEFFSLLSAHFCLNNCAACKTSTKSWQSIWPPGRLSD